MAEGIGLSRWSALLVEEIFRDREGEGRPVLTIDAGGALLSRALARANVQASDEEALQLFVSAFPARWQMRRWFSGVDSPGDALPAFLILCCIAASEAAGSAANDYRERLREMMQWDAIVMDCAALPRLWRRLEASLAAASPEHRLRSLILPDPRHRTQIGHAIELTFPSRQDARRLRRDFDDGDLTDPNHPVAVMRWLGARLARYSPTFHETFTDFQAAWRTGARALTDHRFWSGWRVVVESWRPSLSQEPFHIITDEWGRFQLVTSEGDPTTLRRVEATAPPGLRQLFANGMPILLRELDWGQWTWAGQGRPAARVAQAALIREKSHSANLLARLDRVSVNDAPGWVVTTTVDLLPGTSGRLTINDDDLIDVRFAGVPKIDGGRLARPSFPIRLSTTGPVEDITLSGEAADKLELRRSGSQEWLITPTRPVEADVRVSIGAAGGETVRNLALRASAIAPAWDRELPKRFVVDEGPPRSWSPTTESESSGVFDDADGPSVRQPGQGLLDLIEYLAARPGAMPLGGLLELLDTLPGAEAAGKWAVLRTMLQGGLIDPLRVRGWRGSAVIARSPRSVLVPLRDDFRLTFDGIVNEVLISRVGGVAARLGLSALVSPGIAEWSPPTLSVKGDRNTLTTLATEVGVPCEFVSPDLEDNPKPADSTGNADGSTHGLRRLIETEDLGALTDRGVRLSLCRREAEDAPPVWLVQADGGEPRYWTHRHLALLDACGVARITPASIWDGQLTMTLPGAALPLSVARWLRLVSGVASGACNGRFVYALSPSVEGLVRAFLGLAHLHKAVGHAPHGARRRFNSGMALPRDRSVDVMPVWRWARGQRGADR